MSENDKTLPMVFVTVPNIIARELSVEGPEATGPEVIDWESTMCLSGKSDFNFTPDKLNLAKGAGREMRIVKGRTASPKYLD